MKEDKKGGTIFIVEEGRFECIFTNRKRSRKGPQKKERKRRDRGRKKEQRKEREKRSLKRKKKKKNTRAERKEKKKEDRGGGEGMNR